MGLQGAVVRHKARLVVKGCSQRQGVDYEEVFALVARFEAVRLVIAWAANQGWEVYHLDVKSAFLNGNLSEEVFVMQPPGFVQAGKEEEVYKLKKALYGVHQAPRAWNQRLDASLVSLGFQRCPSDPTIYCRADKNGSRLILRVYVYDMLITGSIVLEIQKFKKQMEKLFKMSDLGGSALLP
jgi:hypothetical protein